MRQTIENFAQSACNTFFARVSLQMIKSRHRKNLPDLKTFSLFYDKRVPNSITDNTVHNMRLHYSLLIPFRFLKKIKIEKKVHRCYQKNYEHMFRHLDLVLNTSQTLNTSFFHSQIYSTCLVNHFGIINVPINCRAQLNKHQKTKKK